MNYRLFLIMLMLLFLPISAFTTTTTYVYDELDRLSEAHYADGSYLKYTYDEIGNLIGKAYYAYYPITVTAGINGTISPASASVYYGNSQTFTMTPATGYHVENVLVDGVSKSAVNSYTFNNVTATHTISATFAINTYVITATPGSNGSISPTATVNYGTSKTFTITPSTGYHIKDVVVDGASQGAINSYAFTNVTATHSISATFEINTYVITVNQGIGEITPESAVVTHGSNQAFNISHTSRYLTVDVLDNGTSKGNLSSYTLSNVTAPHTIEASFSLLPCSNPPVRINGPTPVYYTTLQAAYNAAANGATIQTQGQVFTENFNANRDISVTIDGGYTCDYSTEYYNTHDDKTMLQGVQNITNGVVTLKNFKTLN